MKAEDFELTAHQQFKNGQVLEAKEAYEKALALEDTRLHAHFGLAQALQKLGDYEQALVHLQRCADKANAGYSVCLFQMGTCYLQLGQIQQAKKTLEIVIEIVPHHIEALVNLGSCFLREKNFNQATYYFATACRVDENYLPAQFNLACCLMEAKKFIQAQGYFQRYCEKAPEDLEASYHLGFVDMMLDKLDEAKQHFQKLLNLDTGHVLAMHNMASIALKQNEPSVALGYYQRILNKNPHDEIANYMLAALAQKKSPIQAPEAYVKALFDQYATHFDQHLKESLHYQTPEHLYRLWLRYQEDHALSKDSILDLGCGTGLMGALLKPHAKKLIGVDLSSEMLKVAQEKNLYDECRESEILAYLTGTDEVFDLVVLADVLVYFGDLQSLFEKLCKKTATLLFSLEHTDQQPYELTMTGRYRHRLKEVFVLARAHGFELVAHEEVILREQDHQAVKGQVVLLKQ